MKKYKTTMIITAILVGIVLAIFLVLNNQKSTSLKQSVSTVNSVTMPDGLEVKDVTVGRGAVAEVGDKVTVNYVGSFSNGNVFDASSNHSPNGFTFTLGAGEVIKGWDEGVLGMRVGGERKLIVPPSLAYGSTGTPGGPIPPNATLYFDITLLNVQKSH
jgi:FKBP-type peptidyl-prolyl cis-trans isomerase